MKLSQTGSMRVDPATGNFYCRVQDIAIPCRGGLTLAVERQYNSFSEHPANAGFGGWTFNFDERLRFEYTGLPGINPQHPVDAILYPPPQGGSTDRTLRAISIVYPNWETERFTYSNGVFTAVNPFNTRALAANGDGTYTLTLPGRGYHYFNAAGRLTGIADLLGNKISYQWGTQNLPNKLTDLQAITDPGGRVITVTTVISSLTPNVVATQTFTDWSGRSWVYTFRTDAAPVEVNNSAGDAPSATGYLASVTDPDGNTVSYLYGYFMNARTMPPGVDIAVPVGTALFPFHGLYKITDANGDFVVNYSVGPRPLQKRVGAQIFGGRLGVAYTYDSVTRSATRTIGNEPLTGWLYDENYNVIEAQDSLGNLFTYTYNAQGQLTSATDPRLGVRRYQYDSQWKSTQQTDALGNTRFVTYDDALQAVTQIQQPGMSTPTVIKYDQTSGRLVSRTDPAGKIIRYGYDIYGNPTTIVNKDGSQTTLTWDSNGNMLTVTDPSGSVTTLEYDAVGRCIRCTSPEGKVTQYTYTPGNLLLSVITPGGNVTQTTYDANRNVIETVDALGNIRKNEYNSLNELTATVDALGNRTTYTYTARGNVASMTDPLGRTTRYTYDLQDRQTSVTDPLGNVTSYVYDPYCGTTTVIDPLGRSTSSFNDMLCRLTKSVMADGSTTEQTYNADGTLASTTDALGNTTLYDYDSLKRRIKTTDPLGRTTIQTYDTNNNVTSTTDARGNKTLFQYDANGRMIGMTRRDGGTVQFEYNKDGVRTAMIDGRGFRWVTTYDQDNRPIGMTDPTGYGGKTVYDALGRVIQSLNALGATSTTAYDANGRVVSTTDPLGNVSRTQYDAVGQAQVTIDPLGRAVHMFYDALGRTIRTVDAAGGISSTVFDVVGRAIAVTDANGNTTSYEFDSRDRMTAEIYPDGSKVTMQWDANGNLLSKADPRGFVTSYGYDGANQLIRVTLPDGAAVLLSYDPNGNISKRVDGTGTYLFSYDPENRPVQIVQNGATYTLQYDADGHAISLVYPDGRKATTSYDPVGRVTAVTTPDNGTTSFSYDFVGRRTGISYSNGTSSIAQYDLNSRLVRLVHQNAAGSNITADFQMAFDAVGNMLTVKDGTTPMWTYQYDVLNRLTSATNEQTATTSVWTYDSVGNRLTETVGGVTTSYAYNNLNQLIQQGATRLFWDSNGNLAQKIAPAGVTNYRFDSRDRLVQIQLPTTENIFYGYDQQGRMTTRADHAGTTTFEWNDWMLEREIDPAGHVTRYFYNGSELTAFAKDDQQFEVHQDWLGSVRTATDRFQNTVFSAAYGPWGEQISVTDNVPNGGLAMRWVGGLGVRWDAGAGLYYMRNRFYEAVSGRFASRDRLRESNTYRYAANNPTRLVDPSGLRFIIAAGYDPAAMKKLFELLTTATGGMSFGVGTEDGQTVLTPITPWPTSAGNHGEFVKLLKDLICGDKSDIQATFKITTNSVAANFDAFVSSGAPQEIYPINISEVAGALQDQLAFQTSMLAHAIAEEEAKVKPSIMAATFGSRSPHEYASYIERHVGIPLGFAREDPRYLQYRTMLGFVYAWFNAVSVKPNLQGHVTLSHNRPDPGSEVIIQHE